MRSLIDISELSVDELWGLIKTADGIIAEPDRYSALCRGKKLA